MYNFGKEIRDLKEAENLLIELLEEGNFDEFLNEANIDKDFIIENTTCTECFTLGIDYDIFLDDIFDTNTQKNVIDEIKQREAYANNSLIVGCSSIYLEDLDKTINPYFIASDVFSKSNSDKMLLLSVGFILYSNEDTESKKFVIL